MKNGKNVKFCTLFVCFFCLLLILPACKKQTGITSGDVSANEGQTSASQETEELSQATEGRKTEADDVYKYTESTEQGSDVRTTDATDEAENPEGETEPTTGSAAEDTTAAETSAPDSTHPETTASAEESTTSGAPVITNGTVHEMIRQGLLYVKNGYGYSLQDRKGINGHFDCSGLVAVLLRDCLGCTNYGWDGAEPWDTAWWRSLRSYLNVGDEVQFGSVTYVVTMKETTDYQAAWSVPGSIVVQYSPTNHPEKTMGHISIALGEIPYESTEQVVNYLDEEYGVLLDGTTVTGLPMVYDQYGAEAGHTIFKINANGVANCCIVDNNYASDPEWIEPVAIVFAPKE